VIIALSGVDGAGKTTQLELLAGALEARGLRTVPFWYRPGYSRELDALRAAVRRLRPAALPRQGDGSGGRERAFGRPRVRQAWVAVALVDALLQYALKVRALSHAGRVVLCDRYLADGALDLVLRFPELAAAAERGFALVRAASPRPDAALLLDLPFDEVQRRLAAKDEPFPDAPAMLRARYDRYRAWAAEGRFEVVDAGRSVDAVHGDVMARLAPLVG
jgi:dTMP kinase